MGSETNQPNEALRRQRLLRGWSQQKVADQLGTSEEMVNRWERGKRKASPFYQEKLCILFGKSAEELGFLPTVSVLTDGALPAASGQLFNTEKVTDNKTLFHPPVLSVGGLMVNAIILARGHYGPKEIYCFYDDAPLQLTPELETLKKDLLYELEKRKSNGETVLPYNSGMYKLKDFNVGYREVINVEKVPVLRLKFGPTDYFTQMVTDLNVNHPIRESYVKAASITERPVPEFASILAINLNLVTKDGYLILTEQSSQSFVAGGRFHTSVGENLHRPLDAGPSGAPDPFQCAIRGAWEELGITLNYEDIVFHTFTVIPDFCQYSLISTIRIQQTRAEIEKIWSLGVPSDKWEHRRLLFSPHNPDALAQLIVNTWNQWFNVALAAIISSLLDVGYSETQIDEAFSHARSTFSLQIK